MLKCWLTRVPQNTSPNVADLRNRIASMLSNSDCAKFIKNLINGTAADKNPAGFTDALKGFDMIASQKGFAYWQPPANDIAYSTVGGSISRGNAQVLLAPPYTNFSASRGFAETQAQIEAMSALHETLHHAGSNRYFDDYDYAATVARMRGLATPKFANASAASRYWNAALEAACKPR